MATLEELQDEFTAMTGESSDEEFDEFLLELGLDPSAIRTEDLLAKYCGGYTVVS